MRAGGSYTVSIATALRSSARGLALLGTHSSTVEAGRMAAESGVKTLVLNHLIPGGLDPLPDGSYMEGVREHFAGEVIFSKDQLVL